MRGGATILEKRQSLEEAKCLVGRLSTEKIEDILTKKIYE
jgi:hypothetical protein